MKTIEAEIRDRLIAMGLDHESVEPCMSHIKADPLMRAITMWWDNDSDDASESFMESLWLAAKSSALDYLEKKYHIEAKKEN